MKLKNLTGREVIRLLREDGWYQIGVRGSHYYFKHPTKPGKISVPVHGKETIPPGTLRNIVRQAHIKRFED